MRALLERTRRHAAESCNVVRVRAATTCGRALRRRPCEREQRLQRTLQSHEMELDVASIKIVKASRNVIDGCTTFQSATDNKKNI
ncbi:uncharacterized protein G2W53_044449 [Senna tora]|uniref:Uncharacterized protein n=1 Tax=Senna tora TaxID=362788 RepID=A0A834SNU3_9FABA|nr:uncharacterized protein G2W53_044449 [Senna tora]